MRNNHPDGLPPDMPTNDSEEIGRKRAFPFELSKDVSAGSEEEKSTKVPYDGRIVGVLLGWPSGTDNGVGVQFRNSSGETFLPRNADEEKYLGFNDFTHLFMVRNDVSEDEEIVAEYKNNDPNNSHFVNCVPFIVEDSE